MFGLTPFRKDHTMLPSNHNFNDLDTFFNDFFNDGFMPVFYGTSGGQVKVDIKETDVDYKIEAELPGIPKEDVQLGIENNRLTIHVAHSEEQNEEKDNYIRRERRSCTMSRSFNLENVNTQAITAKFENGILHITLPKQEPGRVQKQIINIE